MNHRTIAASALLFACLLTACATRVPKPSPTLLNMAQTRWPDATMDELAEGRRLFVHRCSSCHNLVLPGAKSAEQWQKIMVKMGHYAKLDHEQHEAVLRFVVTASQVPPKDTSRRRVVAGQAMALSPPESDTKRQELPVRRTVPRM